MKEQSYSNLKVKEYHALIVCTLVLLCFFSCTKNTDFGSLEVSNTSFENVDVNGADLRVVVTSGDVWTATSPDNWISTRKSSQNVGRTRVTIAVAPNFSTDSRSGSITFSTGNESATIKITQNGGEVEMDSVVYDLPLVFHIIYNDATPKEQVPSTQRLQLAVEKANALYAGSREPGKESPRMGVKFNLAHTDPEGKMMSSPGVVTHVMPETELEYSTVMNDRAGGTYNSMAWDRTKYINIFIFKFKSANDSDGGKVLGVSHLPSVVEGRDVGGLQIYTKASADGHNHCVVINSETFSYKPETIPDRTPTDMYNIGGVLAHELGHYLGLFHPFAEEDNHRGLLDECKDTDWCEDTPSYNRVAYEKQLTRYGNKITQRQWQELLQRNSCDGTRFESTNIMDYAVTREDRFTPNQRERMRLCLYFSPLIPGMKRFDHNSLRSAIDGPAQEPQIAICRPHAIPNIIAK